MDFSFETRLAWLDKNHYAIGNKVCVVEKEKAGEAEIVFISESQLLSISLSQKNKLEYINHRKVADGLICKINSNDNKVELHIVECKKTVSDCSWSKAKLQFMGGLINSFGFCGILDKEISKVVFYTAFRKDKLDNSSNTTNPILLKSTLGNFNKTSTLDWNIGKLKILNKEFKHIKIQLDDFGRGQFDIDQN